MLAYYYLGMQVIPAMDLLGDEVVRLENGDYERVIFRHPLDDFLSRVIATRPSMLHVVDLQGARDGIPRLDLLGRCVRRAHPVPVQVSGGLRTVDDARTVLRAGASRVIIGSAAWEEPGLAAFVSALGAQLVVAVDVRDGVVATRGWRHGALDLADALARCRDEGVARLHVTAIDRDGTRSGPDLALYERVVDSGIPVVAAGGVRDEDDLTALEAIGCEAAVMGLGYLPRLGLTPGA